LREEANPGEELDFTDFASLRRESTDRAEDSGEEGNDAALCFGWCGLEARISFFDGHDADRYRASQSKASYHAEDLELRVSKEPHVFGKIEEAGKISNDIANTDDATCH
jgi:hypothetical protein